MSEQSQSTEQMIAAVAGLSQMQIVAEAAGGYYTKLVSSGLPVDAAAEMTKEFHTGLMAMIKSQIATAAGSKLGRR